VARRRRGRFPAGRRATRMAAGLRWWCRGCTAPNGYLIEPVHAVAQQSSAPTSSGGFDRETACRFLMGGDGRAVWSRCGGAKPGSACGCRPNGRRQRLPARSSRCRSIRMRSSRSMRLGLAYLHFIEPRSSGAPGRAEVNHQNVPSGDGCCFRPVWKGVPDFGRRLHRRGARRAAIADGPWPTPSRSAASSFPIPILPPPAAARLPVCRPNNRATFYASEGKGLYGLSRPMTRWHRLEISCGA